MSAPFDVAYVHIQIEFLTSRHYHFDFCLNEKSDLWHLCGEWGGGGSAANMAHWHKAQCCVCRFWDCSIGVKRDDRLTDKASIVLCLLRGAKLTCEEFLYDLAEEEILCRCIYLEIVGLRTTLLSTSQRVWLGFSLALGLRYQNL